MESGNLAYTFGNPPDTDQLATVADALKKMHYDGVGVGSDDLRAGELYYGTLAAKQLPVVGVDSVPHKGAQPFIIKNVDGLRVGVFSFGYIPPAKRSHKDLADKTLAAYTEARKKSDILVVLDQAGTVTEQWMKQTAAKVGKPDVVIGSVRLTGDKVVDLDGTKILPGNMQGTHVWRADITVDGANKDIKLTDTLLNDKIQDDPDMAKFAQDYEAKQKQKTFATAVKMGHAENKPFYPYQTCMNCHEDEYNQWKTTPHARAMKTLQDEDRATEECMSCHSDMFRQTGRVVMTTDTVGGVECQSCHAGVLPHAGRPSKKSNAEDIKKACISCHTKAKSPKFDLATWYNRVKH